MAIAKVADRASANSNSAVTTVDLVLSSLTVDNILIIRDSASNSGGGGQARTCTPSNQSGTPLDIAGALSYQQNNDPGAASAGVTCNVIVAKITATSGTVRLTYSGSVVQACVAEEWSGVNAGAPVVGTPVGADGVNTSNMAVLTDSSVAQGNCAYAAVAWEGPSTDLWTNDSDTTNGSWTALTKVGTTNLGDLSQSTAGGYKVVTATGGQTYNSTIVATNRDSAGLILELAAVASVEATLAAPLGSVTGAATATVQQDATLAAALGSLAASATATVQQEAVLAAPLGSVTATMDATVEAGGATVEAVLDAPLGSVTATSSATVQQEAVLSSALGSLTATANATVELEATLAAPLGEVTAAATAAVQTDAVLAAPLGGITASLTADVLTPVQATLDAPLGSLTASASATVAAPGTEPDPSTGGTPLVHGLPPHISPQSQRDDEDDDLVFVLF